MLDILWAVMLLTGILYGALTGNMNQVTDAALSSAKEAVSLCITMAGIVAMWVGVMQISADTRGTQSHGIYFCQYDSQFSGTWVGGNTFWAESHGRTGETGGRKKTGKGLGNGQRKRYGQQ